MSNFKKYVFLCRITQQNKTDSTYVYDSFQLKSQIGSKLCYCLNDDFFNSVYSKTKNVVSKKMCVSSSTTLVCSIKKIEDM